MANLDLDERVRLDLFLGEHGLLGASETHGYLTGLATGPAHMGPSEWLSKVLPALNHESVELVPLVLARREEIALELDRQYVRHPMDEKERVRCQGYVAAVHSDPHWIATHQSIEGVADLMFYLLVGSRHYRLIEDGSNIEVTIEKPALMTAILDRVPRSTLALHEVWRSPREKSPAHTKT